MNNEMFRKISTRAYAFSSLHSLCSLCFFFSFFALLCKANLTQVPTYDTYPFLIDSNPYQIKPFRNPSFSHKNPTFLFHPTPPSSLTSKVLLFIQNNSPTYPPPPPIARFSTSLHKSRQNYDKPLSPSLFFGKVNLRGEIFLLC